MIVDVLGGNPVCFVVLFEDGLSNTSDVPCFVLGIVEDPEKDPARSLVRFEPGASPTGSGSP